MSTKRRRQSTTIHFLSRVFADRGPGQLYCQVEATEMSTLDDEEIEAFQRCLLAQNSAESHSIDQNKKPRVPVTREADCLLRRSALEDNIDMDLEPFSYADEDDGPDVEALSQSVSLPSLCSLTPFSL